jgi:hypothetical protein
MGDRWNGGGSSKSQYVFLPITITADGKMVLRNLTSWSLKKFTPASINPK